MSPMVGFPTGTVTFLFTDIEGSTRLWQEYPEDMKAAVAQHDDLLSRAVSARGGHVFARGGDSFSVAFPDPLAAALAAGDAQTLLRDADWGGTGALRVRMALDTGLAEVRDGDYYGPPLNRASRILAVARGGQILASHITADLLRYSLPDDWHLRDLGERRLRDVAVRQRIFEVLQEPPARWDWLGRRRTGLIAAAALALLLVGLGTLLAVRQPGDFGTVTILSTQAEPPEEAERMRNEVLAGFNGQSEFVRAGGPDRLLERIAAEAQAERGSVDVVIALHGTYPTLRETDTLLDLSEVAAELAAAGIPKTFLDLGKLGTSRQYYIPVFQATYFMGANKRALPYLPEGADVEAMTWEQLRDWGKNMRDATGARRLGFPAADDGLLNRFLEGYVYPSFTGGMVSRFQSADAVALWEFVRDLWLYVNPEAATYSSMDEPLLSEEVWVAFDHQVRLKEAYEQRPDDFIAFPAPIGPHGLGFMPVIVGVGVPKNAPNRHGAIEMVKYLLADESQIAITNAIGFFPAASATLGTGSVSLQIQAQAVAKQSSSPEALPALLPVGLGEREDEIDQIFRDTFTRIITNGEDIRGVLDEQGSNLQALLNETGAACWPPDPPSSGPCQLEPFARRSGL